MSSIEKLTTLLASPPPWIVGVINLTPDSFSHLRSLPEQADFGRSQQNGISLRCSFSGTKVRSSRFPFCRPRLKIGLLRQASSAQKTLEEILAQAEELIADGAHIIELGAESTAPGSVRVSAEEEIRRLAPVLESISEKHFVSIDTYKASVAAWAIKSGAKMINDVSALRGDKEMSQVIASTGAYLVLMHSKELGASPHVSNIEKVYGDITAEIAEFLLERSEFAQEHGVQNWQIIVDPGMGRFLSSNSGDSWRVLRELPRLKTLGLSFPQFIGVSRKGFLGGELQERDGISQLVALCAIRNGANFIRTHNVKMMRQFLSVADRFELFKNNS